MELWFIQGPRGRRDLFCAVAPENCPFRLDAIVAGFKNKKRKLVWEEVFFNNKPTNNTIIQIWRGNTHEEIHNKAKIITNAGYPVIISSCWYLNYIKYGADWRDNITSDVQANSMSVFLLIY